MTDLNDLPARWHRKAQDARGSDFHDGVRAGMNECIRDLRAALDARQPVVIPDVHDDLAHTGAFDCPWCLGDGRGGHALTCARRMYSPRDPHNLTSDDGGHNDR